MTISKFLPVLCAMTTGVSCITVHAADSDNAAQAAARIALAKALFDAGSQQQAATNVLVTSTNAMAIPAATPASPAPVAAAPIVVAPVATPASKPGDMQQVQALWPLDQGSGSTVIDISGNNHNAKVVGGPATWVTSADGNEVGLRLNGSNFAEFAGPVVDTAQSYTVVARVQLDTWEPKKYQTFVSIDGKQTSGFGLQFNPYAGQGQGRFEFASQEGDAKNSLKVATRGKTAIAPNTWYAVAGVYDADTKEISLYVNGKLQEKVSFTSAWQAEGKTAIGRGQHNGSKTGYFKGLIRDVRLFASALSADQIKDIADAKVLPSVNPSVAPVSQPLAADPAPAPVAAPVAAPVVLAPVAAPVVASAPQSQGAIHSESADNPAQAAARIALAKALLGGQPQSTAPYTAPASPTYAPVQPVVTTQTPAPVTVPVASNYSSNYVGKEIGLKPIASPDLPISASKQEQLSALLQQYKADQITPEEYHKQRAAILAQP